MTLVEVDLGRDRDIVDGFGVDSFPDFRFAGPDGNRITLPAETERNVMWEALQGQAPSQVVTNLLSLASDIYLRQGLVPKDPATLASLADVLILRQMPDDAEKVLESATSAAGLSDTEKAGALIVRGLLRRVGGELEAGLADLAGACPGLDFAEADGAPGVAPFHVRAGSVDVGAMSSSLDPVTAIAALRFAEASKGVWPEPAAKATDGLGALALAVATADWTRAAAWGAAMADDFPEEQQAHARYLTAVALVHTVQKPQGLQRLWEFLDQDTGETFAPDALVTLIEEGDEQQAGRAREAVGEILGPRVPPRLSGQLQ